MILRLAARQRRRLHWRHFLPLAFALLTMLVCVAGTAENVWPGFARLVGDPPDHVTARTEVWGAIYVAAAAVASLAAARFHLGLVLVRFPLVLALATVGVGDEAVANEHGVFATGGEWSVALTAWQRNREPVDRGRLVDVAERVLGRLPQGYEVDAYERRLFAGWRGRLNALFALLGLPTLPIRSQLELLSA